MTPGITPCPALARASAVRGMLVTLLTRPKLLVPVVGILIGPEIEVGSGASRELGVIGLVIRGALGRFNGVMAGRFEGPLVTTRPCGGAGGLVAKDGATEVPLIVWSGVEGWFVATTGELVAVCEVIWAPTDIP